MGAREEVYDAEIAPLMKRIIEIAKAHEIPMFFSAVLDREGEGRDQFMRCETNLPDGDGGHLIRHHMSVARRGMTPKEDRLMWVVNMLVNHGARSASDDVQRKAHMKHEVPRAAGYDRKAGVGDLVVCQTVSLGRRMHPYVVGVVREVRSDNEMLLQELGGDATCWVANEMFTPLIGFEPERIEQLAREG